MLITSLSSWKIIFLQLYNAAVMLQINGPFHRLLLNRLVPDAQYEFFKISKHLFMRLRQHLKVLKCIKIVLNCL